MSRSDPANEAWQELKAEHPEAEQHWVFMAGYRLALEDAADEIAAAANPDQVWQIADTIRDRAAELGGNDKCQNCGHPKHKAECYDCIRYDLREVCVTRADRVDAEDGGR